jgi:hypothetical protein
MQAKLNRCILVLVAGLALLASAQAVAAQPLNYPTHPIEKKDYALGPWQDVSTTTLSCDTSKYKFDVYFPKKLGKDGSKYPILTWGRDGCTAKAVLSIPQAHGSWSSLPKTQTPVWETRYWLERGSGQKRIEARVLRRARVPIAGR